MGNRLGSHSTHDTTVGHKLTNNQNRYHRVRAPTLWGSLAVLGPLRITMASGSSPFTNFYTYTWPLVFEKGIHTSSF